LSDLQRGSGWQESEAISLVDQAKAHEATFLAIVLESLCEHITAELSAPPTPLSVERLTLEIYVDSGAVFRQVQVSAFARGEY
jgi:hypothetical protein